MSKAAGTYIAEAFLYSGQRNPKWALDNIQMIIWKEQWNEAPFSAVEVNRPAVLGYTGCQLQLNEHSYWIISNGCVSFYDGATVVNKKDDGRKMESWLLRTGPEDVRRMLENIK
jgi:hypothetical protein